MNGKIWPSERAVLDTSSPRPIDANAQQHDDQHHRQAGAETRDVEEQRDRRQHQPRLDAGEAREAQHVAEHDLRAAKSGDEHAVERAARPLAHSAIAART